MKKTAMVVEDESIIRLHYELILRKEGFTVLKGTGIGTKAVDLILENRPYLVFMDVNLKGSMTGIDVVSRIREDIPDQIVYYVSAYNDPTTKRRMEGTNPAGIFPKPLTKDAISQIINSHNV